MKKNTEEVEGDKGRRKRNWEKVGGRIWVGEVE